MAARFGRYVAVDWSARSAPTSGADSVWIAVLDADDPAAEPVLHNPTTRLAAAEVLGGSTRADAATLVGIDVGLGYPQGAADLFGLTDGSEPPWRSLWRWLAASVVDDARNVNNRFDVAADLNRRGGAAAGPFWGCPVGRSFGHLASRKPPVPALAEFRATEAALRAVGRRPMSMWQLTGAGSVGSQSLTAIPVLHRWCEQLGGRAAVWPFTTGFAVPKVRPGDVVIAEVWPTQFDPEYPSGMVRDAAQVAHVARRLCAADGDESLDGWFAPAVAPAGIGPAIDEEGWVLGPPPGTIRGTGRAIARTG